MDIIVTIPDLKNEGIKSLIKYYKQQTGYLYFRVSKLPRNIYTTDKCFIISNSKLIGYHMVEDARFITTEEAHELSGNWKSGNYIIRFGSTFHELNHKIPMQGFRGFCYIRESSDIFKALNQELNDINEE